MAETASGGERRVMPTGSRSAAAGTRPAAVRLVGNGAAMMLVGLLWGLTVGAAPYPRLALTAHIQFLVNGIPSVLAGLMILSGACAIGPKAAAFVFWSHVVSWIVPLSEAAGAYWGTKQALPIAAGQAGAPGGAPWQESLVLATHVVASIFLIAAWVLLVRGVQVASTAADEVRRES
ncbi:MAG: hypothetical protein ACKO2K_06800 [Alphaproteobacteria bacterium]